MSLNLIKRTVLECVLTYIVFMILSWLIIDRVIIKHSEMILVSSIVLVISKYLYENTKKYIIAMIIIIFSIMSPIIIKLLIGENIYLDSINRYLGFFISILNLIFILGYYIKMNCQSKCDTSFKNKLNGLSQFKHFLGLLFNSINFSIKSSLDIFPKSVFFG